MHGQGYPTYAYKSLPTRVSKCMKEDIDISSASFIFPEASDNTHPLP